MEMISGGVCAPKGFKASGVHCGIRKNRSKKDLALILSEKKGPCACVYTTNLVKGAPIIVTKENAGRRLRAGCDMQQWKRQYLQLRRGGRGPQNV